MTDAVISRAEARASGLNHYFTGFPCKHGHLSPRYVYNTKCVACIADYHERNKERRNERSRARNASARTGKPRSKGRDPQNFAAWLERTREQRSQRMKEYNAIPENKERKARVTKEYYAKNKGRIQAYQAQTKERRSLRMKAYRNKNKEQIYEKIKEWRSKNREMVRVQSRRRKALKRGASGSHTAEEIQSLLIRQKVLCAACNISIKKKRHLDHIIPLVSGGSNSVSNLQWLCPTCNCSKKDRDPIVFFREKGFLL